MKIAIDGENYNLIIEKKRGTKNTYIRVRENLDIYVTTNYLTSNKYVIDLINKNYDGILKMIDKIKKKERKKALFYYLGKHYDIVCWNNNKVTLGDEKVFIDQRVDLDKWYKQKAEIIFQQELDKMYQKFKYEIPYPALTVRRMKTRWGVCNVKTKRITLNLDLIKMDLIYLDYVIIHELSHLLYANHSKDFWRCVEANMSDYKKIRRELKNDE